MRTCAATGAAAAAAAAAASGGGTTADFNFQLPRFADEGVGAPDGIACDVQVDDYAAMGVQAGTVKPDVTTVMVQCKQDCHITNDAKRMKPPTAATPGILRARKVFGGKDELYTDAEGRPAFMDADGMPARGPVYTAQSEVCVAAYHATGINGGMFRLTYRKGALWNPGEVRHGIHHVTGHGPGALTVVPLVDAGGSAEQCRDSCSTLRNTDLDSSIEMQSTTTTTTTSARQPQQRRCAR